jgi:hypothetical protein
LRASGAPGDHSASNNLSQAAGARARPGDAGRAPDRAGAGGRAGGARGNGARWPGHGGGRSCGCGDWRRGSTRALRAYGV